jgi:hypothetical protein
MPTPRCKSTYSTGQTQYRDSDALPSRMAAPHTWRTHLAFCTRRVRKQSLLGPFVVNRLVPLQLKCHSGLVQDQRQHLAPAVFLK